MESRGDLKQGSLAHAYRTAILTQRQTGSSLIDVVRVSEMNSGTATNVYTTEGLAELLLLYRVHIAGTARPVVCSWREPCVSQVYVSDSPFDLSFEVVVGGRPGILSLICLGPAVTRMQRQGVSLVARGLQKHAYIDGTMRIAADDYVSKFEYRVQHINGSLQRRCLDVSIILSHCRVVMTGLMTMILHNVTLINTQHPRREEDMP